MRIFAQLLFAILLFLFAASADAQDVSSLVNLTSVHVSGISRYKETQVIAASGLKLGAAFDQARLDEATQKLGASGAFEEVRYRYKQEKDGFAAEIIVKEFARFHQCIFDNFIWLSNQEIDTYLRQNLPLYDGWAPESGNLTDEISSSLESLLKQHNVVAHVGRTQYGSLGEARWKHLFAADNVSIKIVAVGFNGQHVDDKALLREAKPLLGREYSLHDCAIFGAATFLPYYFERGYLQFKVSEPATKIANHAEGSSAYEIQVDYPFQEGAQYLWNGTQWNSNQKMTNVELDAALGMKMGELANGVKLQEGWEGIENEYKKRGYIQMHLKAEPAFDDSARKVSYRVQINEGGQFKMGALSISGLPEQAVDRLKSKWRIKPGEVFDDSYLREYLKKFLMPAAAGPDKSSKYSYRVVAHPEQLTADVAIEVK